MLFKAKHKARLDKLCSSFEGLDLSRVAFQKLIKDGHVRVNDRVTLIPHVHVKPGDEVSVQIVPKKPEISSPPLSLKKLHEDDTFIAVEKPPLIRSENIIPEGSREELFLAHRLDKDTSGILILAKGEENLRSLQKQWKERTVQKEYLALVKGSLPKKGRIEGAISRSSRNRQRMVISEGMRSKEAVTEFSTEKVYRADFTGFADAAEAVTFTLVRAKPLTGRTHQIRVHFSAIKHPIVGDNVYGDRKLNKKFEQLGLTGRLTRQFLHATKLSFVHPKTGKAFTIESPLPEDLKGVIKSLEAAKIA